MTIQHAHLTSPPFKIAVAETPRVLSRINVPGCVAAVWQRQPLASFQAWLNALAPEALPQARLILRPEMVNDAITYSCQQIGTPDCPECDMLKGDIAALAKMFSDVASSEYIRLRLNVLDGPEDLGLQTDERSKRLICVYRGPNLTLGQNRADVASDVSVSNGVPFVLHEDSLDEVRPDRLCCGLRSFANAKTASLVLTLEPVRASGGTPKRHAITYH